jgi:hypothetical protein
VAPPAQPKQYGFVYKAANPNPNQKSGNYVLLGMICLPKMQPQRGFHAIIAYPGYCAAENCTPPPVKKPLDTGFERYTKLHDRNEDTENNHSSLNPVLMNDASLIMVSPDNQNLS